MTENNFAQVMESLFKGMDAFLSAKTVIGEATKIGDIIILPLVDVSFGVGAGASAGEKKNGGGGAMTGKMSPSAVLVIKPDGSTKLVNVKNQDTMTKILDMIPDLVDKITKKKQGADELSDDDAIDAAFPEQ
ncbi:MAG: GerW family sporulation protein [Lachnospiraceae bacterium]|nr:GerW family sporulation protein [Lachnospiraceae bacterium]